MKEPVSPRPRARKDDVIVQQLPDETLVYDLHRHRAFCLNRTAGVVWRRCDGRTTVARLARSLEGEIGAEAGAGEPLVWLTLERLGRVGLLEERVSPPPGIVSRREVARRLGAVALLPLVSSILAPTAAQAATCIPLNIGQGCGRGQCGAECAGRGGCGSGAVRCTCTGTCVGGNCTSGQFRCLAVFLCCP